MKVKVRFYGAFARAAGKEHEVKLEEGITVSEAIKNIFKRFNLGKIDFRDERSIMGYVRIFVNGEYARASKVLHDGDEITVYPPISGGY